MAKILVLHESPEVRERLNAILRDKGHEMVTCASLVEAQVHDAPFDLYICGQLGKYSDGLAYAAHMREHGAKVLIVGDLRKFSRMPYLNTYALKDREMAQQAIDSALAGD